MDKQCSDHDSTDGECSLNIELSEKDPLFEGKKNLLVAAGLDLNESLCYGSSSSSNSPNHILEVMLQKARIIQLDEFELYFAGDDVLSSMEFYSSRNELEALQSIILLIDKLMLTDKHKKTSVLEALRNAALDRICRFGDKVREETKILANCSCGPEKGLLQWGESNGVMTKLEIAYVEGAGRGAIAREDLKVGDIALEIPVSAIISEESIQEIGMFSVLKEIDGISLETMLLLWSMKEKHNCSSKFRPYFDTLPEVFNTGLSFGIDAVMALDGTLLLEEIVQAKEHLRSQYNGLFPSLCNDHPDVFPPEIYTWEQFLWACELWYSNSMKVMFPDGRLRTCLIPITGFLNHSICPHITNYGKVDSSNSSLIFRLSRPCNVGEQCYLSYGNFSTSHLVTFYGFLPQGDNPYDVIPLDLDFGQVDTSEHGYSMSNQNNHMVRGTWFSKRNEIFHYGLPSPLLDHLRRARSPMLQTTCTPIQEKLEIELEILDDLLSTFEGMLEPLADTIIEDRESVSWDVKLALRFKDGQRKIVSSIVTSCKAGREFVECELHKLMK